MYTLMLPLLEVDLNKALPFGEAALYGLKMLVVGMLIIFAVLATLWLSLEISGRIFKKLSAKPAAPAEKKPEPVVAEPAPTDDLELIAVLTAAVAAMESAPAARFRVVSFKRK
ncbi:MAG: OadG family protein [Clostridia bacterium]|nr:OadG family protein [Clostridia bacterium]